MMCSIDLGGRRSLDWPFKNTMAIQPLIGTTDNACSTEQLVVSNGHDQPVHDQRSFSIDLPKLHLSHITTPDFPARLSSSETHKAPISQPSVKASDIEEAVTHFIDTLPTSVQEQHDIVTEDNVSPTEFFINDSTTMIRLDPQYLASTSQEAVHPQAISNSSHSSLHLYNMRISQHLRSFSGLSSTSAASGTPLERQNPSRPSNLNPAWERRYPGGRRQPRKSSSGFESVKIPNSWGNVIDNSTSTTSLQKHDDCHAREDHVIHINKASGGVEAGEISDHQVLAVMPSEELLAGKSTVDQPAKLKLKIPHGRRKTLAVYDGSADDRLAPPQVPERRPSRTSISGNYDEAAALWGKALKAHHDDQLAPNRKRSSSFASITGRPSDASRRSSKIPTAENALTPENAPRKARSITCFKPLDTEHSFDRLVMPDQPSIVRSPSGLGSPSDTEKPLSQATPPPRQSVKSHPDLRDPSVRPRSDFLLLPGSRIPGGQGEVPEITLTDSQHSSKLQNNSTGEIVPFRPRIGSELAAWSRYPSHTRRERSLSAGILDNVIPRDFAPELSASTDETDPELDPKDKSVKKKRKAQRRSMMLRKRLRVDLPNLFKSSSTGFRRGETGHRSSIAVGGKVKYAELELLPGSEPPMPPSLGMPNPIPSPATSEGDLEPKERDSTPTNSQKRKARRNASISEHAARVGSSNYASDSFGEDLERLEVADNHLSAVGWSKLYGKAAGISARESTEEGLPLVRKAEAQGLQHGSEAYEMDTLSKDWLKERTSDRSLPVSLGGKDGVGLPQIGKEGLVGRSDGKMGGWKHDSGLGLVGSGTLLGDAGEVRERERDR